MHFLLEREAAMQPLQAVQAALQCSRLCFLHYIPSPIKAGRVAVCPQQPSAFWKVLHLC